MSATHRPAELDLTADFVAEYARLLSRPVGADPTETDDLRRRLAEVEARRDALQAERDALQAERDRLSQSVQALERRLAATAAERDRSSGQAASLRERVAQLEAECEALRVGPTVETTPRRDSGDWKQALEALRDENEELKQKLSIANYTIYQLKQKRPTA